MISNTKNCGEAQLILCLPAGVIFKSLYASGAYFDTSDSTLGAITPERYAYAIFGAASESLLITAAASALVVGLSGANEVSLTPIMMPAL